MVRDDTFQKWVVSDRAIYSTCPKKKVFSLFKFVYRFKFICACRNYNAVNKNVTGICGEGGWGERSLGGASE